jgi:hypothetical protein
MFRRWAINDNPTVAPKAKSVAEVHEAIPFPYRAGIVAQQQ